MGQAQADNTSRETVFRVRKTVVKTLVAKYADDRDYQHGVGENIKGHPVGKFMAINGAVDFALLLASTMDAHRVTEEALAYQTLVGVLYIRDALAAKANLSFSTMNALLRPFDVVVRVSGRWLSSGHNNQKEWEIPRYAHSPGGGE